RSSWRRVRGRTTLVCRRRTSTRTAACRPVPCATGLPRFRNKPVVVIGGGDSAVEEATYLSKFASTVYLVHRRDQLRASKIMQQRAFDNKKITMKWSAALDEVLGTDKDGVTGARLKSTAGKASEDVAAS